MASTTYRRKQLKEILGISDTRYTYFLGKGFLVCSSPGNTNLFTRNDVIKNLVMMELASCGIKHSIAFYIAKRTPVKKKEYKSKLGSSSFVLVNVEKLRKKLEEYDALS